MNNGFKNEKDIVDLLDKKEISEFSEDIKKEIKYTFKEKKGVLRCKKCIGHYKTDIILNIHNKAYNISIKSGNNISVHEEKMLNFCDFLSAIGISERTIKIIKFYHYCDGTIDGSGKKIIPLQLFKLKYDRFIAEANIELNKSKNIYKIINRILIVGKNVNKYPVDYLFYGTKIFGFFISKEKLFEYLIKNKSMFLKSIHFGPFIYQPASRTNLYKKQFCQIKWQSFLSDISKMIEQREN